MYLILAVKLIDQNDTRCNCVPLSSHPHRADPVWHRVSARGAVVGVDDDDSNDDRGNDEDHSEEHVLPDEWHSTGGGGDQLHNDQQEHSQRQQDRDAEGHLLTWETQHTIVTSGFLIWREKIHLVEHESLKRATQRAIDVIDVIFLYVGAVSSITK